MLPNSDVTRRKSPIRPGCQRHGLAAIETTIDLVRHDLDELQVGVERGFNVDFLLLALPFPQIENTVECQWVAARERRNALHGFAFATRHGVPKGDESVSKERAKGGARRDHDG